MSKIKMIWDFRGPNALKIAEHHVKHLNEYILAEKLNITNTGIEVLNTMHAIAFMVVEEHDVKLLRDALKPHRGQIFKD